MEIREAFEADRQPVIALWQMCGLTRPWNDADADFDRALRWVGSTILVGISGGEMQATAMVGYDGHRGWVYYLAVRPDNRRSGFGRSMMEAAKAWLIAIGAPKLQLMVRPDNDSARHFQQSIGLEPQDVATYGLFLAEKDDRGTK